MGMDETNGDTPVDSQHRAVAIAPQGSGTMRAPRPGSRPMAATQQTMGNPWAERLRNSAACLAGLAIVVALARPAPAAELAKEIGDLLTAVEARVATSSISAEVKKLGKAVKRIKKAPGAASTSKDLFKVLSATYGAKSEDQAVLAEARDVLDCLRTQVETTKNSARALLQQLDSKFGAKLEKRLDAAKKRFDAALPLLDSDGKKAAKLLRSAADKYAKGEAFGKKALAKQNAGPALPKRVSVIGTLTGDDGSKAKFNGFGFATAPFDSLSVQGCETKPNSEVCQRVLSFTLFYEGTSRETGPVSGLFIRFNDDVDTEGASAYEAFSVQADITLSSASKIGGTFTATVQARDPDRRPQSYTVKGSFLVKRPK